MKPADLSESLMQIAKSHLRQVWVGEDPPLDMPAVNIWGSTNFRLSPSHHTAYDVVWFYEKDPAALAAMQYELVFDELLRLLGDRGRLIVRYTQNDNFSIITLKHFLGRRYGIRVDVESESTIDGHLVTVFGVRREDIARYRDKSWTFAVLTQGKRIDNLVALFDSIRKRDPGFAHEILVCGPTLPEMQRYRLNYLQREYREDFAEISRKKNDIADAAQGANLCIVHDRYKLDDNYFAGFEQFGYDFDFLTVPQFYPCGTRFPAYCAFAGGTLNWSTPLDCTDYNSLHATQYLNGGFLIAKTQTMRDIRFNDILFWNQAEDVELARAYRTRSLPPRVNVFSAAHTMGITPEYTKAIIPNHSVALAIENRKKDAGRLTQACLQSGRRIEQSLRPYFKKLRRAS